MSVIKSYILFCDNTQVEMFYFDSYTTRPLLCAAIVFGKLTLTGCCLVDFYLGSQQIVLVSVCIKVTTIYYCKIKHGSFSSLCIEDYHGTILELPLNDTSRVQAILVLRPFITLCSTSADSL